MSGSVGLRELDPRAGAIEGARRADGASRTQGAAVNAADFAEAAGAATRRGRAENPLETAIADFIGSDRRLSDALGAPQFPLALTQAAALLEDLAAAGAPASDADAEGVAALAGRPAVAPEDARLYGEAAEALSQHLEARAAFRADASRLVKT